MKKETQRIFIPKHILSDTLDMFREVGKRNMECFALWLTLHNELAKDVLISEVYIPRQYSSTEGGRVIILGEELEKLNRYLFDNKLRIAAQIHSHPEEAFHSPVDDDQCIATTEGAYSIVVPYFGNGPDHKITKFGVFRLENSQWRKLERNEINSIFEIKS